MRPRAYLDIETDWQRKITVIGVHRPGAGSRQWIFPDLSVDELRAYLQGIEVLFTYNGARFDLPVIKDQLKIDLEKEFNHHDLMYECWERSLFGGLKKVEQLLGIHRDTEGIDGLQAIRLWEKSRSSDGKEALEILLRYNREDVENLENLARKLGIIAADGSQPSRAVLGVQA